MDFRWKSEQVAEIVKCRKTLRSGGPLEFKTVGEGSKSRRATEQLDAEAVLLLDLRLVVQAGRFDNPETYTAALVLDGQRIRGIDYSPVRRHRFFKTKVPRGWHENLMDPNAEGDDRNRHVPLPGLDPTDLRDFMLKVAQRWSIDIGEDEVLL